MSANGFALGKKFGPSAEDAAVKKFSVRIWPACINNSIWDAKPLCIAPGMRHIRPAV
jgi:hypothetical protein